MGKGKGPRKRKEPAAESDQADDREPERQTEPKGELVPPPRRPPAALAAETSPSPEPVRVPVPARAQSRQVPEPPVVLLQLFEAVRLVAGTMIDIADAAADALRKRLEGSRWRID